VTLTLFWQTLVNGFSVPLLILLVSLFRSDPRRRRLDVTTVIGYAVYIAIGSQLAALLARTMTRTYDAAFLRADALLRFNPVAFADAISRHWFVMVVLLLGYVCLPVMIGLAWVIEQDLLMRRAVLLAGCVCFAFYGLFPAVGPGHFDWVRQAPVPPAPDNCMPSMHLTWSLLIALNARSVRLRIGLWVYVALMAIATLALREHYLIDLIAAVPYTLAVQWMVCRSARYFPVVKAESPRAIAGRLDGGESQP
jgi:hypothetical protein